MHFKLNQLKNFLQKIQNNDIREIDIQSNDLVITINKHTYPLFYNTTDSVVVQNNQKLNNKTNYINSNISNHEEDINISKSSSGMLTESENYSIIVSPMVGTFYRAPGPNEPAFIEKNDIVEKKQTVCIIEAMKLMNEIEAEVNGEIAEILVQDGDIVDCGQALIKVKKFDN